MNGNSEIPQREPLTREQVEGFIQKGKEEFEKILELSEVGFFGEGYSYAFEQITGLDEWERLSEEQKALFVNGMGQVLGIELVNFSEKDIVRREFQKGVKGEKTQEGADVTVLRTSSKDMEVHVLKYKDPTLATRYEIVKI